MRVERFEADSRRLLSDAELTSLDEAAITEGFSISNSTRDPIQWLEQDCLLLLARYESAIREPDWGSCTISVLLRMPSGVVELELFAYPSSRQPKKLKALLSALSRLLTQFGYRVGAQ